MLCCKHASCARIPHNPCACSHLQAHNLHALTFPSTTGARIDTAAAKARLQTQHGARTRPQTQHKHSHARVCKHTPLARIARAQTHETLMCARTHQQAQQLHAYFNKQNTGMHICKPTCVARALRAQHTYTHTVLGTAHHSRSQPQQACA